MATPSSKRKPHAAQLENILIALLGSTAISFIGGFIAVKLNLFSIAASPANLNFSQYIGIFILLLAVIMPITFLMYYIATQIYNVNKKQLSKMESLAAKNSSAMQKAIRNDYILVAETANKIDETEEDFVKEFGYEVASNQNKINKYDFYSYRK